MEKSFFIFVLFMSTFYISAHGKIHSAVACEGQKLKLSCYYGGMISIIGADYGRWNATVCPYYDDPNMDLQCHSLYAFTIIKSSCDGHTNCKFKVNNDNLMDPCPGQIKYAEVKYLCIDKPKSKSVNSHYGNSPTFGDNIMNKGMHTLLNGRN